LFACAHDHSLTVVAQKSIPSRDREGGPGPRKGPGAENRDVPQPITV